MPETEMETVIYKSLTGYIFNLVILLLFLSVLSLLLHTGFIVVHGLPIAVTFLVVEHKI